MTTSAAAEPQGPSRGRIITARILVIVGVILTTVSILAVFVKREALDESTFKDTSSELIANPTIRAEVASTLADQLYANVDISQLLEDKLPENLQGLAGPIAGLSQEYAARAADEMLSRPKVQDLFVGAASLAQRQFIEVLHGDTDLLDTSNGNVVLDVRPLVLRLGDRFQFVANLSEQVPAGSGQVVIIASDDLDMAQKIVHWLEVVANWIWILALACWVGAFLLVKGRRRHELRAIGIGLAVSGIAVLVVRGLAGNYFVENVVQVDSVRPAAEEAWRILTDGLAQSAWGVVALGVLATVGAWAAGPGRRATTFRGWMAPALRKPELAWLLFAAGIVLLVWVLPLHRLVIAAVLVVLAGVGFEALRRQTATEFPEGTAPDLVGSVKARVSAARPAGSGTAAQSSVSTELERLAGLHAEGKLSDEEFAAAKAKLL
jgi:hypothetical protein